MVALTPTRHIQTATDEAAQLLNCVWVIELQQFVLIENPKRRWNVAQFNEAYGHVPLPARMTPERYIRRENAEFRVANHMDMSPDKPHPIYRDEYGFKVFNLYRGNAPFPETSRAAAGPKTYLEHLSYIYGSKEKLDHALQWMAHLLYRPEKRINHGLILSGKQGTGKSTIAKVLTKLIGTAHRTITPALFTSDFQDWYINIRLAIVEEMQEKGGYSSYNKIKHYFTEDEIPINPKGKTMYNIRNHVHFMLFSNHPNPLYLEEGDRRIHYVESPATKREPSYYDELYAYLDFDGDASGVWAFGKYLRDVILRTVPDNFSTKPPPITIEHISATRASVNPMEDYIQEERATAHGFYNPGYIFQWKDLKADLKADFANVLRSGDETSTVLSRCNISREWHYLEGKRYNFCWFNDDKKFNAQVRHLFGDSSYAGRKELKRIFYGHTELGGPSKEQIEEEGWDMEAYKAWRESGSSEPYIGPKITPYKYPDFDDLD